LGYYASGVLGDKYGLVKVLTSGMWLSMCLYFVTAILGYFHLHWKWSYVIIWALQGPAQGCILTITVSIMSNWFTKAQKHSVMTFWGCNASVGNILGQWVVILVIVIFDMYWRWVMMCAGLMIGLVATYIFFFITDKPVTASEIETLLDKNNEQNTLSFWKAWELPGVALCAFSYGGVKLLNYSFLMWLPYYLVLEHDLPLELVSVFTTLYDLGGILASVLSGALNKSTGSKTIIVLAMLGCSVPTLICFKMMSVLWILYIIVPILGLLLAGTANIISASISADLATSSDRNGSRATIVGLINGTGSLGAAFGQIFVRLI
jgi:OPA family glycerol-3-phosphate transporter-like MFS transporter 1/2